MAFPRWRLRAKHYLNVPGTEWEHKEQDRNTGKMARKVFQVPMFLDPADPNVQNRDGDVIVTHGDPGSIMEHVFVGEPTPDMEPLNDEARVMSEACRSKWKHPIESLSSGEYSQSMITAFERQMTDLLNNRPTGPVVPLSANGINPDDFAKLQEQVAALMARNAELEATSKIERRA